MSFRVATLSNSVPRLSVTRARLCINIVTLSISFHRRSFSVALLVATLSIRFLSYTLSVYQCSLVFIDCLLV